MMESLITATALQWLLLYFPVYCRPANRNSGAAGVSIVESLSPSIVGSILDFEHFENVANSNIPIKNAFK